MHCLIAVMMTVSAATGGNAGALLEGLLPRGLPSARPVVIAHRGGVVGPQSPECSPAALAGAAAAGYEMVELDVRSTRDGVPLLFHEARLDAVCGIPGSVDSLDATAVQSLRFSANGEAVLTLRQALERCRELKLGVMLDIKTAGSEVFFRGIREALQATGYAGKVLCINHAEGVLKYLAGDVLFRVDENEAAKLPAALDAPIEGVFWFGLPKNLPDALVEALKARGVLVIPAINTFRYAKETHLEDARADIERLSRAGVDAFQIDSCYQQYLGLQP